MRERSELIAWIRGELVGPSRPLTAPALASFQAKDWADASSQRRGPVGWQAADGSAIEEVLYYDRETPHRKYGAGILHPSGTAQALLLAPDQNAVEAADTLGVEPQDDEVSDGDGVIEDNDSRDAGVSAEEQEADDFEVTSPDVRHPSTIGISFCARLENDGRVVVGMPQGRRFSWQGEDSPVFPLNGRYERCTRRWTDDKGRVNEASVWRRRPALLPNTVEVFSREVFVSGRALRRELTMPGGAPIGLRLEVFPRRLQSDGDVWLITVVLRNTTPVSRITDPKEALLYQSYFEVTIDAGSLEKYPESQRPFNQLDDEEQSLALLYRESATWGIGHGCAAGWDAEPERVPRAVYADVMPGVQVPSMTPDIKDDQGRPLKLSMRSLSSLSEDQQDEGWQSLNALALEYANWIEGRRAEANGLPEQLQTVAVRHLNACQVCLDRINGGISLLRNSQRARVAFRLANLAMLLQQIATKQLSRRSLVWNPTRGIVNPDGSHRSPWQVYEGNQERDDVGSWRAFQIAFLLMSLEGVADGSSSSREVVDLIWFPTGGGKTEAYLGVVAFYMFHERLLPLGDGPQRDGTNVLMRYTLRMLTTQQFQRAASLICAMEFLRRNPLRHKKGDIHGGRFSLGLWIGSAGSPNKIATAKSEMSAYRRGFVSGNPLVLTECPWCRGEIGRYDGQKPQIRPRLTDSDWNTRRTKGVTDISIQGPLLHCPDSACAFGAERWQEWLPVEVIDERIYRHPPSLVIGTADKLAMIAYRPDAGALFGRRVVDGGSKQVNVPPGLIIQDELHLISGPLGTMYGLYESIFERLCSRQEDGRWVKPKLIASTATIRGVDDQVRALYARVQTQLFPSPGLVMGDSFFGTYARREDGGVCDGRLYLGIHANDYGSILTTQVRAFSSALFLPYSFSANRRDPWWSLLIFYNSIRELGGAKTLLDSDIRSRLKFMFNREDFPSQNRRTLRIVEELTSRLSQAEIVGMLDLLAVAYSENDNKSLDACLASNIIEVGVDIDRLSLMGVVGQPKTTAQYIQVTGRVGRRWWERPGLVLTIYNPSKSRDRSHFEQFHAYHRRLYERVEPTSATPFALSAIQRALPGALLAWARQQTDAPVSNRAAYEDAVNAGHDLLRQRCQAVQLAEDVERSLQEMDRVREQLDEKWAQNPQEWEDFPQSAAGEYLMLWPGQFATRLQKDRGVVVPSSMRQVDASAELNITQGYALSDAPTNR